MWWTEGFTAWWQSAKGPLLSVSSPHQCWAYFSVNRTNNTNTHYSLYFINHKTTLLWSMKLVLKWHKISRLFFFFSLSLWAKVPKAKEEDLLKEINKRFPKILLQSTPLTLSCQLRHPLCFHWPHSSLQWCFYDSSLLALLCYLSLVLSFWIFVSDFICMFLPGI